MKIVKVYLTELTQQLIDVTALGDPGPGWSRLTGQIIGCGVGYTVRGSEIALSRIILTPQEHHEAAALMLRIAERLAIGDNADGA